MSKKIYKSMQGRTVDIEAIKARHELTVAVGNAGVNARGDKLGNGGKILKKREDIVAEYYEDNPNAAPQENVVPQAPPKTVTNPKPVQEGKKKV
jgi:hypothetical protein